MSVFRVIASLGFAVMISTAAYSAQFVGQQIAYLHQKLSPPSHELSLLTDWPNTDTSLPKLEDQLGGRAQKTSPVTLSEIPSEEALLHPSR